MTESFNPDVRELRRIALKTGATGFDDAAAAHRVAAVVDVETTGLNGETDAIIELAVRRFKFDDGGRILEIGASRCWREDPGVALPEDISRLTGIKDEDLVGQRIDDDAAVRIIGSADLVIAHNASFDRPLVERRLSALPPKAWACSCREIDWRGAGFDGRALGWLCAQAGWFYDAHRADGDVDAVIQLLSHQRSDGVTLLSELAASAASESWLIEAIGADYAVKDALRLRGYRWDPKAQHWWREVFDRDRLAEEYWLAREIYAPDKRSRAMAPRITRRTAHDRYR